MGDVEKKEENFLFKSVPSTTLKMVAKLRLDQISLVCLGGSQVRPLDSLHRCKEQRCYLGEDTGQNTWRILERISLGQNDIHQN